MGWVVGWVAGGVAEYACRSEKMQMLTRINIQRIAVSLFCVQGQLSGL
jgi:hypothetical protein